MKFISTLIGSPEQLPAERATLVPVYSNPTHYTLDRVAENHSTSHTIVKIQRVYGLDRAPVALADFAGGTLGKLVITTN